MKIKKKLLCSLFMIPFLTSPIYAYNIYNQMPQSVYIKDTHMGGMRTSIAVNSYASCNPKAKGCYGNINFGVFNSQTNQFICSWSGEIGKGKGNYFVISPKSKTIFCNLEYYHD